MDSQIVSYNNQQHQIGKELLILLADTIDSGLSGAESKIWHAHPVWFLKGNPIVGYSVSKNNVRLLFWSGQSFEEEKLSGIGKFKAAEIRYAFVEDVNVADIKRWLKKSKRIQWDYKNLIKNKGKLVKLK